MLETSQSKKTRLSVVYSLAEIGQGNPEVITALVGMLETTHDEYTRESVAWSLGEIGQGNPEAIAALVEMLETTQSEDTRWRVAESLNKIITTPQQYAGVVSALKDNLSDEIYQNNFKLFNKCYQVLWNCAANLPYPQFYQAWHHSPTTPHP